MELLLAAAEPIIGNLEISADLEEDRWKLRDHFPRDAERDAPSRSREDSANDNQVAAPDICRRSLSGARFE